MELLESIVSNGVHLILSKNYEKLIESKWSTIVLCFFPPENLLAQFPYFNALIAHRSQPQKI